MPNEVGKFTIGVASITVDDKRYTTKPQPIEVIAERASERPAEQGAGEAKQKSSPESRIAKDDIMLRLKL